jgi:hypothetical protein
MHISTAPCVNSLTCSKLFFRSRCVVPTSTASLTALHCTEVVLVTTTSPIVEWYYESQYHRSVYLWHSPDAAGSKHKSCSATVMTTNYKFYN